MVLYNCFKNTTFQEDENVRYYVGRRDLRVVNPSDFILYETLVLRYRDQCLIKFRSVWVP